MTKTRIILALISDVSSNYEPLGIECLAGHLNNVFGRQIEIKMLRVSNGVQLDQLLKAINTFSPDVLGLSLDFNSLKYLHLIIPRANNLGIKVICGNILATFNVELLLHRYPNIIIAKGSGELAMAGIIHYIQSVNELKSVPNIAFVYNGAIIYTKELPSPIATPDRSYSKSHIHSPQRKLYLEASRGCPHRCAFCAQRQFFNSFRAEKGLEQLESDIRQLCHTFCAPIKQLDFVDEDVLANPETALTIAKVVLKLKSAGILNDNVRIMCCLSVRSVLEAGTDSVLKQLALAGLDRCFIGIESFSSNQLRRLGKPHSKEDTVNALNILRQNHIKPADIGFIMFEPQTSLEDILINCQSIRAEKIETEISNPLHQWRALPGTEMCNRLIDAGVVERGYDPAWLAHEWIYADKRVAEIVRYAKDLESGLILVESAIKVIYRSEEWYCLSISQQVYVLNCKSNLNRLFIGFLEASALLQKNNASLAPLKQKFNKKVIEFLENIIDSKGGNQQTVLVAARKALKIKTCTTSKKLLLPQDYPKN